MAVTIMIYCTYLQIKSKVLVCQSLRRPSHNRYETLNTNETLP